MISKSLNFTFSVTVRPREPLFSQFRQTLSIDGGLQFDGHELRKVAGERVLGADRLPDPVRTDLSVVDASTNVASTTLFYRPFPHDPFP